MKILIAVLTACLVLSTRSFPSEIASVSAETDFSLIRLVEIPLDLDALGDFLLLEYSIPDQYLPTVKFYSELYGVPENIIINVIYCESRGNPKAVNDNGSSSDFGIMQINSKAFETDFKYRYNKGEDIDYFCIDDNIRIGVKHLSVLYSVLKDWKLTVAAYNCGLSRLRSGKVPAITKRYVKKVFGHGLGGPL
jgi:soluble lytic murein transglycosylase-like protein